MNTRTRTNYKKMAAAVATVDRTREEMNRIARMRIGVISGGPSIHAENAAFDAAVEDLRKIVVQACEGGARFSKVLEVLDGEISIAPYVGGLRWEQKQFFSSQR